MNTTARVDGTVPKMCLTGVDRIIFKILGGHHLVACLRTFSEAPASVRRTNSLVWLFHSFRTPSAKNVGHRFHFRVSTARVGNIVKGTCEVQRAYIVPWHIFQQVQRTPLCCHETFCHYVELKQGSAPAMSVRECQPFSQQHKCATMSTSDS